MKKTIFVIWTILAAFVLTSCGTTKPYQTYKGEPLPQDQVAYLKPLTARTGYLGAPEASVHIKRLDGKKVFNSLNEKLCFEILPGKHTVEVFYETRRGNIKIKSNFDRAITFNAEAGHVYYIISNLSKDESDIMRSRITGYRASWMPEVVDKDEYIQN